MSPRKKLHFIACKIDPGKPVRRMASIKACSLSLCDNNDGSIISIGKVHSDNDNRFSYITINVCILHGLL